MSTPLDEHIAELSEIYTDDYELLADMKEARRIIIVLRERIKDTSDELAGVMEQYNQLDNCLTSIKNLATTKGAQNYKSMEF